MYTDVIDFFKSFESYGLTDDGKIFQVHSENELYSNL